MFEFTLNTTTGIYLQQEIAHLGDFTFVNFQASQQTDIGGPVNPDISVQTNGDQIVDTVDTTKMADRQKGVIITTDTPNHELTVCIFNNKIISTDASMHGY